jgi:hypothetical protein
MKNIMSGRNMVKNKIFSLILIICSLFVFCGCANVEYQRITDDTGQILDKLIIELDEKALLKKMSNVKLAELKQDIKTDLDEYVLAINYLKPELQNQYADMDFYSGIVAKTIPWIYQDGSVCRISIEILYKDSTYLQCLNGSADSEDGEETPREIVSNLFISKLMMYSDNVFMDMENMAMDNESYYDYYTTKYSGFTVADVNLTQVYGTTDKRLKSNADYKTRIDGINYHLWEIDTAEKGYNSMQLTYYYATAVGTGWYIVALSVSFGLAIMLLLVYIIRKVKDRKYRQKIKRDMSMEINWYGEE